MKKSIIAAGAASVALAAMPIVGVFADPAADQLATDTIQVTVNGACSFDTGSGAATYSASGANGASVSPSLSSSNEHTFTVFCNNNGGYNVTASATALNAAPATSDSFAYMATLPSGATAAWNAEFSQAAGGSLTIEQLPTGGASTKIVSHNGASVTGGETFKAAYTAYIGTATPEGVYSGTISYTLATGA